MRIILDNYHVYMGVNMIKFKEFIRPTEEFIAFSNAGGRKGQYDKFDYAESFLHGQGGGPQHRKESIDENLNPRNEPQRIKSNSSILSDPEKNNNGLGEEHNSPENIGTPDTHGSGHVFPEYNDEQAKNARALLRNTNDNAEYHGIISPYTDNSYNLNDTLIRHHRNGTNHPRIIKSHLDWESDEDEEDGSEIDTHHLDSLISSHRLPHEMTVYSGLHFHPNEHRGKIAHVPSYMSTSLSPHVAKDFGKEWEMGYHDGNQYRTKKIKNILRLQLPKGHEHLFADNGSNYPGQGELILPRGMRYQLGQKPTHIIDGKFDSHFGHGKNRDMQYHIWNGRVLPRK